MVGSRALQEEHPSTPPPPPPPPSMVQCLKKDSKFSDCKRQLYKPDPRTTIGPTIYSFHLAGLKEAQKCNPVTHCSFCIHSSDKCPAVDKSIFVEHLQACHQKRCLNWQVEDTVPTVLQLGSKSQFIPLFYINLGDETDTAMAIESMTAS